MTDTMTLLEGFGRLGDERVLTDPRFDQHVRWQSGERLHHLFEQACDAVSAGDDPGRPAVDAGYAVLSYPELDGTANQLARLLLARGARPGDRIGLLFDRGTDNYLGMLAALKAQAAFVPLDPAFPTDRLEYIAEDAGVRFVLSVSSLVDRMPGLAGIGAEPVLLDRATDEMAHLSYRRLTDADHGGPVDDLAYLIYTSGTTGRPKGVAVHHASICNFLRVAAEVYGLTGDDRMYQGMSLAFDFSVEEVWVPWLVGATLVPRPPGPNLVGHDLHQFLSRNRVTALCCVPTLLATVERDLPELRFLLVSGEACPRDLVARWHRPDRRFLNVYGPTEATVTATWTELEPDEPVTIGTPLPSYSVVILDPDRDEALRPGEQGEIGIAGIGLAAGYLNRDDLTDRAFIRDFLEIPNNPSGRIYRTGDLGRVTDDGEVEYLGRIDTQVKIRGYRIELTEIESVLLRVPGIAQAVVDTYRPEPGVVDLVAYYSRREDTEVLDRGCVATWLRDRLPPFMVPVYLEELDAVPMAPSGKADRKALPPPKGPRGGFPAARHVAPRTPLEESLAEALAGVTRVSRVSVEADFFADLGADSLLMAQFCARLRTLPGVPSVPAMADVYRHPTVAALAHHLESAPATDPRDQVAAGRPEPFDGEPAERAGTRAYLLCGAAQVAVSVAFAFLGAAVLVAGLRWLGGAATVVDTYQRAVVFAGGAFLAACALPILAKWVLVGRWRQRRFPVWSAAYFRFWLVRALTRLNPMALFVGSPMYPVYLRLLGVRVGRGTAVFSRTIPVATDLISIGDRTVIRRDVSFTGYRVHDGQVQLGEVALGDDVLVGDAALLDIETGIGDGGQLGHASALLAGQRVPAGERWLGSPARPGDTDFRTVPDAEVGPLRKLVFSLVQLALLAGIGLPLALTVLVVLFTRVPVLAALLGPDHAAAGRPATYLVTTLVAGVLLGGGLLLGLATALTLPRLCALAVRPDREYRLYGVRYWLAGMVTALTNAGFTRLAGDSAYVTHYLRALGFDLSEVRQTGSNFGLIMKQDSPYASRVGSGTMVSDGLTIANLELSNGAFRMSRVAIGADNFLGNHITYPSGSRAGDNVLLATKVMVPVDGERRENVGLLGSPPIEIPRSVRRDARFDDMTSTERLPDRLAAKLRHNTGTILLYLLFGWWLGAAVLGIAVAAVDLYGSVGLPVIPAALLVAAVFGLVNLLVAEWASTGFRRLRPQFHSIYDRRFWRHERFWKFTTTSAFDIFNGTPFKGLVWRLLGVRVGKRLFDDGCSLPERSIVSIGDDCTLNAGSSLWCHSLEDGTFKSDRIALGARVTLGVGAFAHYGVRVGDGAVLEADSFLMKGEQVAEQTRWQGNPARPAPVPTDENADSEDYIGQLLRRIRELEGRMDDLAARASAAVRRTTTTALLGAAAAAALVVGGMAVDPDRVPSWWQTVTGGAPATAGALAEPPTAITPPAAAPSTEPAGVRAVRDYYAKLPGDVLGAFAHLTPSLQRRSGGISGFTRAYRNVASVQLIDGPVSRDATHLTATVRIQLRGGAVRVEQWEYALAPGAGSTGAPMLLDTARPVPAPAASTPAGPTTVPAASTPAAGRR